MVAKVKSSSISGISSIEVTVEAQIIGSLRRFSIVGLPDSSLKEAKDRVRCALENSGFSFPHSEVVVNLSPASVPKNGSGFDLAIAVSVLVATGMIETKQLENSLFFGELGLDGSVKAVKGVLACAERISKLDDKQQLFISSKIANIAAAYKNVNVIAVDNLEQVVKELNSKEQPSYTIFNNEDSSLKDCSKELDFTDVVGHEKIIRALEISIAGGHNILLLGPPGSGKSMLAKRLTTIMPELSLNQSLEVTKVKNTRNDIEDFSISRLPPFRCPHHSITSAGLIGGREPGEVSLAHRGVLFLDEFTEIRKDALEALREPIENKNIVISRANLKVKYPSDFILVAAANPCSRGSCPKLAPDADKFSLCHCSEQEKRRYRNKLSGPIMDRIDIQIWVPSVPFKKLINNAEKIKNRETSIEIKKRISTTREKQYLRANQLNSTYGINEIKKFCKINKESSELLNTASKNYKLSTRAVTKIIKISRTIADLEDKNEIEIEHLYEALSYRMTMST